MKTELLIAAKGSGKIWEVSPCVEEASWTTNRTGSPGKFEFSLLKAGDIAFFEGDTVRFCVDGQLQFFGWVFSKEKDRWGVIRVTCYDRLRYFKANASYAFYDQTAGQILRTIAKDLQVDTGRIDDTGCPIPSFVAQDQSCLDMVEEVLQKTLLRTGKIFVLFDDGNGVALREAKEMMAPVVIGEKSLLTDYTYKTDIDEQTYNSVKLARPNTATGGADVFLVQDSSSIAQWGLLQLYQSVDGAENDAQLMDQAKTTLAYHNQRLRTLSVSALGVNGLRAGQMVRMRVPGLGDMDLDQYVLLEKVSHTWKHNIHTMSFDTLEL